MDCPTLRRKGYCNSTEPTLIQHNTESLSSPTVVVLDVALKLRKQKYSISGDTQLIEYIIMERQGQNKQQQQNNVLTYNVKVSVCLHQVIERGLQKVLVLEDDVRFEPWFKRRLQAIMDDVGKAQLDWDLM